jgi:PIN domain nuclease of toxin-antitoxin system
MRPNFGKRFGEVRLPPRFLLDTHIVVRWLADPRRLTREQSRVLDRAGSRSEPLAISAISLLEIAMRVAEGAMRIHQSLDELFATLEEHPLVRVLPLTFEIANETALLGVLRDPADRVIAATARVHGLRLVTSDQRIVASNLVSTVE